MIPYGKHNIDQDDIDAVINVLKSDWLTQGPKVPQFEKLVSEYCGASHSIAVNSATSALHVACMAMGVGTGDIIWTSSISFVASANCARYCNADIEFIDINPSTYNICVVSLEENLKKAKNNNCLPKVVIPVAMTGMSCDMKKIRQLSKEYNFLILEDASHALGGEYSGLKVGSCSFSDATVLSFHPVKMITSIEGGMILCNSEKLAKKMRLLREHGINKNHIDFLDKDQGPWHYEQTMLGYNYRMNDVQAALGISQLKKLDYFVKTRNEQAKFYNSCLSNLPIELPSVDESTISSFHLYIVRTTKDISLKMKKEIFKKLHERGILVGLHYAPIYRHPYYKNLKYINEDYPNSELFYRTAISLPIYPGLSEKNQIHVKENLEIILNSFNLA